VHVTRRSFVELGLQSAAALTLAPRAFAAPAAASREPLRQFDYANVQLTGGPFFEQYTHLHAHYLALSNGIRAFASMSTRWPYIRTIVVKSTWRWDERWRLMDG